MQSIPLVSNALNGSPFNLFLPTEPLTLTANVQMKKNHGGKRC